MLSYYYYLSRGSKTQITINNKIDIATVYIAIVTIIFKNN